MLRITSFFIFLCFSSNVLAIDLSGSYFGIRCKNNIKCVDGEYGTGLLGNIKRNIQIFPKNKSDKRALLLVHHNIEENLVSIFFPHWDYRFVNMALKGDSFDGKDDKAGNTQIIGNFLDDTVRLTFKRFEGQQNEQIFFYKAVLTENEKELRNKINELEKKENEIDQLENTVINKNNTIDDLDNNISKNKKDIKGLKEDVKNKEIELSDTIINKNSEIDELKDKHKNEISNLNSEHNKKIEKLKDQKKTTEQDLTNTIDDILSKPLKINPKFLQMRSETNDECNLYTSPSDEAKIITPLQIGTKVENLAVLIDNNDWSLVATGELDDGQEGLLGYLFTDCLGDIGGIKGGGGDGGSPPTDEKISITFPKWDKGKKGSKITIDAPGFISLKGKVNIESGITEVQLNGEPVSSLESNGRFEAFFIAREGDNEMILKVIDKNNEIFELNFIVSTK